MERQWELVCDLLNGNSMTMSDP